MIRDDYKSTQLEVKYMLSSGMMGMIGDPCKGQNKVDTYLMKTDCMGPLASRMKGVFKLKRSPRKHW